MALNWFAPIWLTKNEDRNIPSFFAPIFLSASGAMSQEVTAEQRRGERDSNSEKWRSAEYGDASSINLGDPTDHPSGRVEYHCGIFTHGTYPPMLE
jgi:hypothetical protein